MKLFLFKVVGFCLFTVSAYADIRVIKSPDYNLQGASFTQQKVNNIQIESDRVVVHFYRPFDSKYGYVLEFTGLNYNFGTSFLNSLQFQNGVFIAVNPSGKVKISTSDLDEAGNKLVW